VTPMKLVLDTSTKNVSMGIANEKQEWLLELNHFEEKHQQSRIIFELMEKLFRETGCSPDEIRALVVGIGPGSYTGLRVGLSFAKTWSFARHLPLFTFDSLELLKLTEAAEGLGSLPKVKYLPLHSAKAVENLDQLQPIYLNDHFAEG